MGGSVSSVGDDADHANAGAGTGRRVEPSTEAVPEQLERILGSAEFVASDRLKRFLRFIVEEALAGRADRLKAYTIALEVFGRDPGFDPQNDPVVRMEAGKLRRRLERYFLGTGRDDPVRIEIPKGHYAPIFSLPRDDVATAEPAGGRRPLSGRHPSRRGLVGLAGLTLAGLVLLATIWLRSEAPNLEAEAELPVAQERGPAIIVLPFENLSDIDKDDVFASGLTQELVSNLMRFGELRLYSAYGSFLEEPTADPVELGERLDVGYVVKGSVRREPDWVRLIVHLIEAQTGEHLWTETYDRALTPENLFEIQEQLAADLASQLAQPYGIIQQVTADSFRRERPETLFAYDCVLRAFDYRRTQGREKHAASRECLEEAVRRDPGYADAWAVLADNYLDEFRYGYSPRPYDPAALDQALSTARHAVELDRDSVLALLALSTMHFYRGEFAKAEEIHRRLLSLNPTNPHVLGQVGWRTARAGNWDEGIALVRQSIDRSITAPWAYHMVIALDHYRREDYHAALAKAEPIAGARIATVAVVLAAIHGQLGNKDEARRALDRARTLDANAVRDPRAWLRRAINVPEGLIDQLMDGLAKTGLPAFAPTSRGGAGNAREPDDDLARKGRSVSLR
jgi:TolB-like protein/Flp pilus assembly protein TadD